MRTLKAKVVKGHLVMNEPTDLPEGTEIDLVEASADDYAWVDSLDDVEDPAGLKDSLRESENQIARSETMPIDETLRKLRDLDK